MNHQHQEKIAAKKVAEINLEICKNMENFYLKKNPDWENKTKYGYVEGEDKNLVNRLSDSSEEHSELSNFTNIYGFEKMDNYKLYKEIDKIVSIIGSNRIRLVENIYGIKLPLLTELNKYLVVSATKKSNEFIYNDGIPLLLRVLKEEFPLLGLKLVKEYSQEEIEEINNSSREYKRKQLETDYQTLLKLSQESRKSKPKITKQQKKDEYKWYEREYQRTIIENGLEKLTNLHKFYLELATGGGKSYIIYKILSKLKPKTIVIFSPRKNINNQNCSSKYLSILDYEYLVYNCSNGGDFTIFKEKCLRENKKMIIVACPQGSNEKVYNLIHDNLNDIFIWFDEAHHTIEKWVDKLDNKYTKYFLENSDTINNRIFTSASPDKEQVGKYPNYFGELYSPIKVKELISLGWLCPINCKILEFDIPNFNLLTWILEGFIENNKSFGFSFHSRDNNAFNLFYKHYQQYLNSETDIKPYLLIHDAGLNETNRNKMKDIRLDYNFRNVTDFENKKLKEENPKNMAYVVKQYDMGYDFQKLDYIVITDPKVSFKDIIQCIGRGTRPDKKGPNGTNLEKVLLLMLPTYIKEEDDNDYKNIIEVLRYLILDLDMDIEKILIKPIDSVESKETVGLDYKGTKKNSSKLLDLLYANNILNRVNTKTLNKFCVKYSIKTEQDYYRFKAQNPSLNLKNNLYEYPGFYWKNVVDPNNEVYYSSKSECKKSKEKLINEYELKLNEEDYDEFLGDIEDNGWIELNKYDAKLPPYRDLDKFYPQL